MLDELKEQVCRANVDLGAEGLVIQTFGNVSGIDRERNLVAIKPSGVAYEALRPNQIVVVSLETGQPVEVAAVECCEIESYQADLNEAAGL